MTRKYIIVTDDSFKGFDEEIEDLERKWGAEEIEPCEDCISRQAAIEAVKQAIYNHDSAIMRLTALPPVTPQPKMGRWIDVDSLDGALWHACSECGETEFYATDYCPNCGARMEVSE